MKYQTNTKTWEKVKKKTQYMKYQIYTYSIWTEPIFKNITYTFSIF